MINKDWFNEFVDTLKNALKKKLTTFLNFFFPGLLILEILLNKGFYNDNIQTLYDLILYILWGCLLSSLFNASFIVSIEEIFKSALIVKKTPLGNVAGDKLNEIVFGEISKNKSVITYIEDIIESYTFIFSGIRVGLLYMIYKIIDLIIMYTIGKIYIMNVILNIIGFNGIVKIIFSFIILIVFNKMLKSIFIRICGRKLRKHFEIRASIIS